MAWYEAPSWKPWSNPAFDAPAPRLPKDFVGHYDARQGETYLLRHGIIVLPNAVFKDTTSYTNPVGHYDLTNGDVAARAPRKGDVFARSGTKDIRVTPYIALYTRVQLCGSTLSHPHSSAPYTARVPAKKRENRSRVPGPHAERRAPQAD